MRDHQYCGVEAHCQATEQPDKSPDLPALVFVASEEISCRIQDDEPRLVLGRNSFDLVEQCLLSDLSRFVRSRENRISDTVNVDDPEPCKFVAGNLRMLVYVFKPMMKLSPGVLGADVKNIAGLNLESKPVFLACRSHSQLQTKGGFSGT